MDMSLLARLQGPHRGCRLLTVVGPPRAYGMMWSISRATPGAFPSAPQLAHWFPYRAITCAAISLDAKRVLSRSSEENTLRRTVECFWMKNIHPALSRAMPRVTAKKSNIFGLHWGKSI